VSRRRLSHRKIPKSAAERGEPETGAQPERSEKGKKMVRVATYFAMTFGAFLFWQSMDRVHVWIALHQDEKVLCGCRICGAISSPSLFVNSNRFVVTMWVQLVGSIIALDC
jgi:hypothetical protein